MAGTRARAAEASRAVLIYFGLKEDERLTPQERRRSDLTWAVLGPIIIVTFVWSVFGSMIGMVSILVMVPFLVVGIREVLSRSAPPKDR